MSHRKKILICPLNWGLGHATRDIPLINLFIKHNFELVIAASGDSYKFLEKEFPELKFICFNAYKVRYSKSESQIFKMLILIPKIIFWTVKEHNILKKIIKEYNIDIVFSDNRFGLWNRKTFNIFMTHQLKVKFPGILKFLDVIYQFLIRIIVKKYDECWIPDFEGSFNLSGELSHVKSKIPNRYFIEPLSRFSNLKKEYLNKDIDVLFVLSGPEPQRNLFENIIYEQTKNSGLRNVIVRGTSEKCKNAFNFPVYNMINTEELISFIKRAEFVVCRSGYSSVMDMFLLNKKAILVPTPGQTEQEYLAEYLMQKGLFYSSPQRKFNLNNSIKNVFEFSYTQIQKSNKIEERIINLKEKYNYK